MNTSWRTWRASFYVLLLGVLVACGSSDTAPTVTLTASPDTITVGESSELSWTLAGDDPISLSLSPDVVVDLVSPLTVSPTETTTYTLTATNDAGSSSASVTVTVQPDDSQPEPGTPTIDAFSASVSDLTATFTWTLTASAPVGCTVNFGDGSAVQTLGDCLGTQTITHTYDAAGTYTATLALTSGAAATTSLTVVGSSVTPTDCAADFVITNQSDLNALSGCSVIGSLTIDPTAEVSSQQTDDDPITSLAPLSGVTSISRSLVIANTALTDLTGLDALTSVGGDVTISGNGALASLTALSNLTSVGGNITISDNGVLPSLAGLENIAGYDDANTVQVIDNSSLDCSQPALAFSVDVSQGNAVDCTISEDAINSVRFLAPLEYLPNLNIFVPLTAGISQRITIERYGRTADPLTVQVQVLTPPSTIAVEDIRINGNTFIETFEVTFPATRSRTTFDLRVVGDALDKATETLALAFVETPDYGLVEPAELRFDVQEPVIIADVCRGGGEIVVTTQSELEQLSECTIIDGNLTIDPTADSSFLSLQQNNVIFSLRPFTSLTSITGSLTISNTNLIDLNGLQSLISIGGNLTITNNSLLVSLSAMVNLSTIGGDITISNNATLVTLFNLDNLVDYDNGNIVTISNNASFDCTTIEIRLGNIEIDISIGNGVDCPTSIDIRIVDFDICDISIAQNSGGVGVTVTDWDISAIPEGATFDVSFDTFSIPDSIVVVYPVDETGIIFPGVDYPFIGYPTSTIAFNTGWRGDSFYNNDPVTYPGGIAGSGFGQESDIFVKGEEDRFRVIVTGRDPGTLWTYQITCRSPEDDDDSDDDNVVVPLAINSFTATPDAIEAGESSTLAWTITGINPINLNITPDVGDVSGQDSIEVSPTETTTYTLTASNDSGTVTEEVTVTVNAPEPVAPTITSFTATPDSINSGDTSTLAWEVTGDEPITLTIEPDMGDVSGLDSVEVSPTETTIYTLTADNGVGSATAQVTIVVTDAITGRECDGAVVESLAELEALRGCEVITGNLAIIRSTDIVNLEPLENLVVIQGYLDLYANSALTSLTGLGNLSQIEGYFKVGSLSSAQNDLLTSFDGLDSLITIGGSFFLLRHPSLTTVEIPTLASIGDMLTVRFDESAKLIAFENLVSIGGNIRIRNNEAVQSVDLGSLEVLDGGINIYGNDSLVSIEINRLTSVGGNLSIVRNNLLDSIAMNSLNSVLGGFFIGSTAGGGNASLTTLTGFNRLAFIGGDLFLYDSSLMSLEGLENVSFVGNNLSILRNDVLTSMRELANLTSVGGNIRIADNDVLPSLAGIENITGYDNDSRVSISGNENLDCAPPPVLPFIVDSSSGNAVDCPTP